MRRILALAAVAAAVACSSSDATSVPAGSGILRVQLTDAPFPFDSVESVDIWVVRVDAKLADATEAEASEGETDAKAESNGWTTVAEPNKAYDLLKLRNGTVADIGTEPLPAGSYRGFRFIIDPSKSGVKLKGGMTLTGTSSPSVTFPSGSRSGIKVNVTEGIKVEEGSTSTVVLDFDLESSFVMRGNSLSQNGLLFKPLIKASAKAPSAGA